MGINYEAERLKAVREYLLFDVKQEVEQIAKLAALLTKKPIALVTLLDEEDQFILAGEGINLEKLPRANSFCTHAIEQDEMLMVKDATQDDRFKNLPSVTGDFNIRFYASANLESDDGYKIGTLCVYDQKPSDLSNEQMASLKMLATQVNHVLRVKKQLDFAVRANETLGKIAWTHAHRVRAPLSSILGMINLIKADEYEFNKDYIQRLEVSAIQLDGIVREVVSDSSILEI